MLRPFGATNDSEAVTLSEPQASRMGEWTCISSPHLATRRHFPPGGASMTRKNEHPQAKPARLPKGTRAVTAKSSHEPFDTLMERKRDGEDCVVPHNKSPRTTLPAPISAAQNGAPKWPILAAKSQNRQMWKTCQVLPPKSKVMTPHNTSLTSQTNQ